MRFTKKINWGELAYEELVNNNAPVISAIEAFIEDEINQSAGCNIFSNAVASNVQQRLSPSNREEILNTNTFKAYQHCGNGITSYSRKQFINSVIGVALNRRRRGLGLKFKAKISTEASGYIIYEK